MQTAIRSEGPRLVDFEPLPPTPSNNPPSSPRITLFRRASTSSVHNGAAGQSRRPHTSQGSISEESRPHTIHSATLFPTKSPQLNRWSSGRNSLSMTRTQSLRENQSLQNLREVERNRKSMLDLAEFFRTKAPPPGNLMSQTDSDNEAGLKFSKQAILEKVVGRRRSKTKKTKEPRLIQLPDTAVAARTKQGNRHIAISIPVQYDYLKVKGPPTPPTPEPLVEPRASSLPPGKTQRRERGPIVVLKPVREVRESITSMLYSSGDFHGPHHKASRVDSVQQAAAELPGSEPPSATEDRQVELAQQGQSSIGEEPVANLEQLVETTAMTPPASPVLVERHDSQRSEPREFNGTAYSTTSQSTIRGHSRGPSSASTVTSCGTFTSGQIPQSQPQSPRLPLSLETELRAAAVKLSVPNFHQQSSYQRTNEPDVLRHELFETPPPTLDIEEPFRETFRADNLPPPSPPPNRALPDLPPKSPKSPRDSSQTDWTLGRPSSTTLPTTFIEDARQRRQERLKARKQKDVAAARRKSQTPTSLADLTPEQAPSGKKTTRKKAALNTISPIMIVADLSPHPSTTTHHRSIHSLHSSTSLITPTHSRTSIMTLSQPTPSTPTPRPPSSSATLRTHRSTASFDLSLRRQQRKAKRNASLKEKVVEARLKKLEYDNAVLDTLSGIAGSFGQLNGVMLGLKDQEGELRGGILRGVLGLDGEDDKGCEEVLAEEGEDEEEGKQGNGEEEMMLTRRTGNVNTNRMSLKGVGDVFEYHGGAGNYMDLSAFGVQQNHQQRGGFC